MAETDDTNESEVSSGQSGALGKIIALVIMALVVATECMMTSMFLSDLEAGQAAPPPEIEEVEGADADEDMSERHLEVDLYEFQITSYRVHTNTTLYVNFHLWGTIGYEDELEFLELRDKYENRFRDMVITTIRSSDPKDLTDAGLGLIKRKILATTNAHFTKGLLKGVIVSELSIYEQ